MADITLLDKCNWLNDLAFLIDIIQIHSDLSFKVKITLSTKCVSMWSPSCAD